MNNMHAYIYVYFERPHKRAYSKLYTLDAASRRVSLTASNGRRNRRSRTRERARREGRSERELEERAQEMRELSPGGASDVVLYRHLPRFGE